MRVLLVAFGRLKTAGLRETADYYRKILRPWANLEEIELKPCPVPDKSPATRTQVQEKEAQLVLERIGRPTGARVPPGKTPHLYLLEEGGKAMDTQEWAKQVRFWEGTGATEIVLCVGSSLGFSAALRKVARGSLSLGPQTLSHELARVVLLEQLYRAWSVVRGHPYHVEG